MGFDGFTMPPAIAGEDNDVSADSDGATNWLSVTGGLAAVLLAFAAASHIKDRIVALAGADEAGQMTLSVN